MSKFYLVGGAVRDKLLGRESKDLDYAVEASSYEEMKASIIERGGTIFLEQPNYLTIRAKVPNLGVSDFVLCRKESHYTDGRHPESVTIGDIYDDLARRDMTMNAIAIDEYGKYIDPHNGIQDINNRLIRCVGNPMDRFNEDRLRILRALRFAVTKNFTIEKNTLLAIQTLVRLDGDLVFDGVSIERIREELLKMFAADTVRSIHILGGELLYILFEDPNNNHGLWLKPTLEERS